MGHLTKVVEPSHCLWPCRRPHVSLTDGVWSVTPDTCDILVSTSSLIVMTLLGEQNVR